MNRYGHIGAGLLAYAPIGLMLQLGGLSQLVAIGALTAASCSTLPDIDLYIPICSHRELTHTVWFMVGAAIFLGTGAALVGHQSGVGGASPLGMLFFGIGCVSVGSHLLVDACTPMGISPLRPLSTRRYSLGLTRSANPLANGVLLSLGIGTVGLVVLIGRM